MLFWIATAIWIANAIWIAIAIWVVITIWIAITILTAVANLITFAIGIAIAYHNSYCDKHVLFQCHTIKIGIAIMIVTFIVIAIQK